MTSPLLTYAQFEQVIGKLFEAGPHAQAGALRGRLKHLVRLGVPLGSTAIGGRRKSYADEDIFVAVACLDLEEAGLDPKMIAQFIGTVRRELVDHFTSARAARWMTSAFLCLNMDMMSGRWTTENDDCGERKHAGVRFMGVGSSFDLTELCSSGGVGSATWLVIDIGRRLRKIEEIMAS